MRRDRDVAKFLGLGGPASATADVVFSPSVGSDGDHASRSTTHGGFDDDASTMNSVALRVLGLKTKSELKRAYPEGGRALLDDPWTSSEVEELRRSFAVAFGGTGTTATAPPAGGPLPVPGSSSGPAIVMPPRLGARRALCVGIDRYPVRPLAGCVADARLWAKTLSALGFDCTFLLDEEATYSNIVAALEQLVKTSRRGDSIVWQYAGHGTQVPDVNGDEADGDSPGQDEAICPIDLQAGRMVTDDEIGAIVQQLPPGVAFTMMMDCCHSGTLNRFGIGDPAGAGGVRDERARFLPLTAELKQAYLQFAQSPTRRARSLTRSRSRSAASEHQRDPVLRVSLDRGRLRIQRAGRIHGSGDATAGRARRWHHQRRLRQCRHRGVWLGATADADDRVCRNAPGPADLPVLRCRPVDGVNWRPGGMWIPPPHVSCGRPTRSKPRPANCGRCKPCPRTSRMRRPPPRRPRSRPRMRPPRRYRPQRQTTSSSSRRVRRCRTAPPPSSGALASPSIVHSRSSPSIQASRDWTERSPRCKCRTSHCSRDREGRSSRSTTTTATSRISAWISTIR